MLPGGMGRLFLAIVAVFLFACDEEDPSTSEHCRNARAAFLMVKASRAIAVKNGGSPFWHDQRLGEIQNENWQCFR